MRRITRIDEMIFIAIQAMVTCLKILVIRNFKLLRSQMPDLGIRRGVYQNIVFGKEIF